MAGEQKTAYLKDVLSICKTQATIVDVLYERYQEHWNNAYNIGGADEITDADLAQFDISQADYTLVITLIENLNKMFTNVAVTQADYLATLNKVRRAPI